MVSLRATGLVAIATLATAVFADYTIDPESVPLSMRGEQ